MVYAGLLVALLGFLFSVLGLGITASVGGRLVIALLGNAVTLFGIVGMINPAYLKRAIWRKS